MDRSFEDYYKDAKDLFESGKHLTALEVIEDIQYLGRAKETQMKEAYHLQGDILLDSARDSSNAVLFLLGSVECFCRAGKFSVCAAEPLFRLGEQLNSVCYYEMSMYMAIHGLKHLDNPSSSEKLMNLKDRFEFIKETVPSRILEASNNLVCSTVAYCKKEDRTEIDFILLEELGGYWARMNTESKRNFMQVSTAEFRRFVDNLGVVSRDALEKALSFARKKNQWTLWVCRSCSLNFGASKDCRTHLEQEHGVEFNASSRKDFPEVMTAVWASKIRCGIWKPVKLPAAVEMIENQLEDVKAFAYHNGWSKEWPLAADEERSELLKEIQFLLVSLYDLEVLPCSISDWMMSFVAEKLEVSDKDLADCHLMETPQSICFLDSTELNQILGFLKDIKRERVYGIDMVISSVKSLCAANQVKEQISFDSNFSVMLLDRKFLRGAKRQSYDHVGKVEIVDPRFHYGRALPGFDESFLSWLCEYSTADDGFEFPKPIRGYEIHVWLAVLRATHFTYRVLESKYKKKLGLLKSDSARNEKAVLLDSEMMRLEKQRKQLVDKLTTLSLFDYRSYLNRPLKKFLVGTLRAMDLPR